MKLTHPDSCPTPQQHELQPSSSVPEHLSVKCAQGFVSYVEWHTRNVLSSFALLLSAFKIALKQCAQGKEYELLVTTRDS